MLSRRSSLAWGGLLVLGLVAFSAGCSGPNYRARATVKGKVTFGNKNLTTGSVMFHGPNNLTGTATIDKEGNYEMNDAPIGEVTITVSVPQLPAGGMRAIMPGAAGVKDQKSVDPENPEKTIPIMGDMPSHVVPIPDKYSFVERSGLTYTVVSGEQTHNITLLP